MVPICRTAMFLLPGVQKAMPSRMPETQADKNATAMMGHPTRAIQQGPTACPSCGRNHRAGTVCFNKGVDVLSALFAKGTITISGQKRGNPYRDEGTGRFAASPGAGGAGGGGGGGLGAPTQENTVMGARAPQAPGEDIGSAKTQEGSAPNPSVAAPAPSVGGEGPKTMPGKEPVKNQTGISPSMIARHEAQQKEDQGFLDAFLNRNKDAAGAGPKPVFSHQGAQEAYEGEKARAMGAGASNEEAHAAGMKAGGAAYAQAIRDPNAPAAPAKPAAPAGGAPTSSGPSAPTAQGGAATVQSPAPTMSGAAPAPAAGGGPAPGGAPGPAAPGGAAPAAPGGGAGGAGGSRAPAGSGGGGSPGTGIPKGAKKPPSLLDELSKPWSAAGGSIGAGMFTPGGTVGGTNAGVTGTAHGLLSYAKQDKPGSAQHQQQAKNAQGKSGFMQNQQAQQQGNMRQFAGGMGAAGGGALPGGGGAGAAPGIGGGAQHPGGAGAAPAQKTNTMGRTP